MAEGQHRICQLCQDIEFAPAFTAYSAGLVDSSTETENKSQSESGIFLADVTRLHDDDTVKISKCAFCNLLHGFWTSWPTDHVEPLALRAFAYNKTIIKDSRITAIAERLGDNSITPLIYLAVVPAMDTDSYLQGTRVTSDRMMRVQEFGYIFISSDNADRPSHLRTIPVPGIFDFEVAKTWLSHCLNHHQPQCSSPKVEIPKSLKLIDCERIELVSKPPDEGYAALSYVWGPTTESIDEAFLRVEKRDDGRLPVKFPSVIDDAMTATRALGLRYLWVDKYCIDQHNSEDLQEQISNMDIIYREALVTLIAASCADFNKLSGVGETTRTPQPIIQIGEYTITSSMPQAIRSVDKSRWATRGWTFQEGLLSRSLLHFTDEQAFFLCSQMYCQESLRLELKETDVVDSSRKESGQTSLDKFEAQYLSSPSSTSLKDSVDSYAMRLNDLRHAIAMYTKRDLTYPGDIIRAFAGVLRSASDGFRFPIMHVWGLPLIPASATNRSQGFEKSLLWLSATPEASLYSPPLPTSRIRQGFPTWSWTGHIGPIYYPWEDKEENNFEFNIEIDCETETKTISTSQPSQKINLNDLTNRQFHTGNQPRILYIKSRYWNLPFHEFKGFRETMFGSMFVNGPSTMRVISDEAETPAEEVLEALGSGRWRFLEIGQFVSMGYLVMLVVEQREDLVVRVGVATVENVDTLETLEAGSVSEEEAHVRLI